MPSRILSQECLARRHILYSAVRFQTLYKQNHAIRNPVISRRFTTVKRTTITVFFVKLGNHIELIHL